MVVDKLKNYYWDWTFLVANHWVLDQYIGNGTSVLNLFRANKSSESVGGGVLKDRQDRILWRTSLRRLEMICRDIEATEIKFL